MPRGSVSSNSKPSQLIVTLSKKYIFEIKIFSKMNDQTDLPDVVLKNDSDLNTFDIIEGLQSISNFFTNKVTVININACFFYKTERLLSDVLYIIFGYLDGPSLLGAELVSLTWKAALSDGYPSKLWAKLLQQKAWLIR